MPRKRKARRARKMRFTEEVAASVETVVPVLHAPVGSTLTVEIDIENPSVPYTVAFDDRTLMYSQVDRREAIENLQAGTHRLAWSFTHLAKGWKHELTARVSGQAPVQLESRAEARKDPPYSVGVALVIVP
jgi:hypothetical protein